jgi:hypothetical protein
MYVLAEHHGTIITHLDLRLELFYGKQQTARWRNEIRQRDGEMRLEIRDNNTAQHITHLVLELLHQLELLHGKQKTSRRNEMRDIE